MQHFNSWTLIVLAIVTFTFLPTQAAIVYNYPPPAKQKKKRKNVSQKRPKRFSFFKKKTAPKRIQQAQARSFSPFYTVLFICFLIGLVASIWGLIYLTFPVISAFLIGINAVGLILTGLRFFYRMRPTLGIITSAVAVPLNLLLIGIAFMLPWLWITATVILALLVMVGAIFLILALLLS